LQRQRGLVHPNAVVFTDHNFGSRCNQLGQPLARHRRFVDKHLATNRYLSALGTAVKLTLGTVLRRGKQDHFPMGDHPLFGWQAPTCAQVGA